MKLKEEPLDTTHNIFNVNNFFRLFQEQNRLGAEAEDGTENTTIINQAILWHALNDIEKASALGHTRGLEHLTKRWHGPTPQLLLSYLDLINKFTREEWQKGGDSHQAYETWVRHWHKELNCEPDCIMCKDN